jgi:hypothetical protein
MRISSFPGALKTRRPGLELVTATAGAAALGTPAAAAGWHLGKQMGPDLVRWAAPHALRAMHNGWVSPHTLLTWGPKALQPLVQAQAGALLLGSVGVVAGVLIGVGLARS